MNTLSKSSILLAVASIVLGCGGDGGGSNTATNPFLGAYTGTYEASFLGDRGTFNPTVANDGAVSGVAHSDVQDEDGTISGRFTRAGVFTGTILFPGQPTATLSGNLTRSEATGVVSGTLTETVGGRSGDVVIELTPVQR